MDRSLVSFTPGLLPLREAFSPGPSQGSLLVVDGASSWYGASVASILAVCDGAPPVGSCQTPVNMTFGFVADGQPTEVAEG